MKLTPSSTARRRTAIAPARSCGGPQTPSPVIRIAPKPRRLTVSLPASETVPLAAAGRLIVFSDLVFMCSAPEYYCFIDARRSDRCHFFRRLGLLPSTRPRLQYHPDQCCYQDRGIELSNQRFRRCHRSRNPMYWISVIITHAGKRGEDEEDQSAPFPS